ncbi:hypothetical protein SAMN05216299_103115 [Nitrosospira sp. Nsp14]|nr:hypothetical protein SAMN05216299_103115 [Nitrosospira sp. Nsp14]
MQKQFSGARHRCAAIYYSSVGLRGPNLRKPKAGTTRIFHPLGASVTFGRAQQPFKNPARRLTEAHVRLLLFKRQAWRHYQRCWSG